ncbi:MAG: SagB/ThcOx family dehydrogenase [Nitrososphaerota archaeon]
MDGDGDSMNRRTFLAYILAPAFSATVLALIGYGGRDRKISRRGEKISLPPPRYDSNVSIEYALKARRSIREYEDKPLTLEQLGQLAWAAQGITEVRYGFRTAPSAGATYPLEVYIVVKKEGMPEGVYHYVPREHVLELVKRGDYSRELMSACLDQEWVRDAAINIVITAIYERTTYRYGERGRIRYVHMEVGHVGQNVYLQCVSLGLGCVVIGAFYDEEIKRILGVDEEPLYVIPVGVKKGGW